MSLTLALNAAVTGLSTAQAGLDVISSNIANVNTEGYTRKVFDQNTLVLAGKGAGVQVSQIRNNVDQNLLQTMRTERSASANSTVLNTYLQQIQDTFGTTASQSSLAAKVSQLAQDLTTFATDPTTATGQLQVLQSGQALASTINNLGNTIQQLRVNADREIAGAMSQINSILSNISKLNDGIALNQATNRGVADLEDKRDVALNQLADLMDIRYFNNANGTATVFTTDGTTLVDSSPTNVSHTPLTIVNPTDAYAAGTFNAITVGIRDVTNSLRSGKLKGLVDLRDDILPDLQSQIDEMASALQQQINLVHNRGVGFPSMVNNVTGNTKFLDPNTQTVTFSGAETNVVLFKPDGTELSSSRLLDAGAINFTNGGTLASMASQVQSWIQTQDPQLANASVSFTADGQLAINLGTDGFGIGFRDEQTATKGSTQTDVSVGLDFEGDGQIDKSYKGFSNFLGLNDFYTSGPKLTEWSSDFKPANYTLTTTSAATLSFIDTANVTGIAGGTITVNPGDSLKTIRDKINSNAALQGTITASVVPEGAGERLRVTSVLGRQIAVTQQGGTDAIDALGLDLTDAARSQSLKVNQTLVYNPAAIAHGKIQLDPLLGTYFMANADNANALELSQMMTSQVTIEAAGSLAAGSITLGDYASTIIARSASQAAVTKTNLQQQRDLASALEQKQSQLSGVNLDEEMSQLMIYQNSYAASAKVISATKSLFDILNNLID